VTLADNLALVRDRIRRAALAVGRDPAAVSLVAVTKTWPAAAVRDAYALGLRDFGENYAQEFVEKADALTDLADLRWHFIGHLQTNKARVVAPRAAAVHTVDTAKLARELGLRAAAAGRVIDAFVQVSVAGEAQKSGCAPAEVAAVCDAVAQEPSLRLRGLMTVPPHTDDPAGARPHFEALAALRDTNGGAARLPELSMGMTHDLEVAIACGATRVRVGSALFGSRG
jgi:pyridoxal phosphate enzyme (YggS family)